MSDSVCLYCEQPLALIHRLSGEAEFCSKEHRRLYRKEDERRALERLLQAAPRRPAKPPVRTSPPPREPAEILEEPTVISLGAILAQVNRKSEPATKPEPAKKKAADPAPAGFARANGFEPRSSGAVLRKVAEVETLEWKPVTTQQVKPRRKPDTAATGAFLSPGSFLPRRIRLAALAQSEFVAGRNVDTLPFPIRGAELEGLRERLRRADRVGFCPP